MPKKLVTRDFGEHELRTLALVDAIVAGDKVHLKPKSLERLGLAERQLQGGEGVIVNVTEDIKGKVYTVKIHRGGRTRLARLEDLVVRRKGKR
jgi:hypothetical protein